MAQQQGVYEEFLEEQRRKRTTADDLEGEFAEFLEEQRRKRPARPSPASAGGSDDVLDSIIDEVMSGRPQNQIRPEEERRRRVLTGQIIGFEELKRRGKLEESKLVAKDIQNRWGDLMEVGIGEGGWPYVKPRAGSGFTAPQPQTATQPVAQAAAEYARLPWHRRRWRDAVTGVDAAGNRLADTLVNLGEVAGGVATGDFRPLLEQAEGAARGLVKLASAFDPAGNAYEATQPEQDKALADLRQRQAERRANDPYWRGSQIEKERIAAEEAAAPGFVSSVTRGIVSGGLQAAPYIATGILSGGSVPALAAVGAAQSDYTRPEEAAMNVGGAVAPVYAGRALTPVIGRAASVLPGKVAQGAGRAAGQVGVGAGTNVAQAALAGERDPRKLAEAATVGGLMSGVDAARAARRGAPMSASPSRAERYRAAIQATPAQAEVRATQPLPQVETSPETSPAPTTRRLAPVADVEASRVTARLPELSAVESAPAQAELSVREAPTSDAITGPRASEAALDIGALPPTSKTPLRGRISETVGGVQMAAQLGSPRFVIRNVLQHVAFGKQERAATRLAAALDWAYSKATGKPRQIAAPRGSDLAAYVRNWGKAVEAYKKGEPLPGRPNEDYLTADSNKLDRAVNKLMTWINEIPDAAQWQTRFEQSLQSITEAAKKSKALLDADAAIDQAKLEADRASLRDPNFISTALVKLKESLNTASSPIFGTDKFGVGDFVAKYVRTPGSLLKRGIERSPLGLFQVAKEAFTPGPFRRRNTLLALSRVAEGAASGLGLGAALAAARVLVGPEEESRTGRALEREEGVRGYSFNPSALGRLLAGDSTELREGDTLYSIDWAQPWAMNLSAGAALYNLHKRGEMGPGAAAAGAGEAIYDSLAKTLDVMGDQSVLKNLSRYMGRATGENFSDRMLNFARAIGLDIPSSFVPSLARSARQVADPYERDTRAEDRAGVQGFAEEATNRAFAQLPGLSQTLPTRPSVLTGEPKKTALGSFGPTARAAAQISPANISTYQPHPIARETARLRDAGFEVSLGMPKRKLFEPTSVLREREMGFAVEFSDAARRLIEHPLYNEYADEVKASALNNLAKYLRESTTKELRERTLETIISAAAKGVARRKKEEE